LSPTWQTRLRRFIDTRQFRTHEIKLNILDTNCAYGMGQAQVFARTYRRESALIPNLVRLNREFLEVTQR
jgi:hypothetical protein